MESEFYPLTFRPVYMPYIWGGRRLATQYRRQFPGGTAAESWEISDRPEGPSIVANGPLAGQTLSDLTGRYGERLVGTRAAPGGFPLLFKIIDARERISLQIHPSDQNAATVGGEAKTEAWYFLEGTEDAAVITGLEPGVGRPEFEAALREDRQAAVVRRSPVAADDVVFIPGGRVHAIDAGCLLYEVQQNSNTTYRIFDWGRIGPDGQSRELHVDQALAVIDWTDTGTGLQPQRRLDPMGQRWEVVNCEHFRIERWILTGDQAVEMDGSSFQALFVLRGGVTLRGGAGEVTLPCGSSGLVPAALPGYEIAPQEAAEILVTTI